MWVEAGSMLNAWSDFGSVADVFDVSYSFGFKTNSDSSPGHNSDFILVLLLVLILDFSSSYGYSSGFPTCCGYKYGFIYGFDSISGFCSKFN